MIIRAPLSPPLLDPNIRACWAPKPVSGVVPDLSGHGFNGTIVVPGIDFEEDPYFGPALHNHGVNAGFTFPCTLGLSAQGTFGVWYTRYSLVLPPAYSVIFQGGTTADYLGLTTNGVAQLLFSLQISGVQRTVLLAGAPPTRVDVPTSFIGTYDGAYLRVFLDGE